MWTVAVQSRTPMAITGCYYPPCVPSATNRLPMTPRLSSPHHVRNVLFLLLLVLFTAAGRARLKGIFKDQDPLEGQPVADIYARGQQPMQCSYWRGALTTPKRRGTQRN